MGFLAAPGPYEALLDARELLAALGSALLERAHGAAPEAVAVAVRGLAAVDGDGVPASSAHLTALLERRLDDQLELLRRRPLAAVAGPWMELLRAVSAAAPGAGSLRISVEGPLPRFLADLARHLRRRLQEAEAVRLDLARAAARLDRLALRLAAGDPGAPELGPTLSEVSQALTLAPVGQVVLRDV